MVKKTANPQNAEGNTNKQKSSSTTGKRVSENKRLETVLDSLTDGLLESLEQDYDIKAK